MTGASLDKNVELGVYIDDLQTVHELIQHFDELWSKASSVAAAEFEKLERFERGSKGKSPGKAYGSKITFAKAATTPQSHKGPKLGWILVHTRARYPADMEPTNPIDDLELNYKPGKYWHWMHGKPLNEGGPYRLLLAWENKIFGEATAKITHQIEPLPPGEYNFAFVLMDYNERKQVDLGALPLTPGQLQSHRDLIKLNQDILNRYDQLKV
jgi:hypothetical protein